MSNIEEFEKTQAFSKYSEVNPSILEPVSEAIQKSAKSRGINVLLLIVDYIDATEAAIEVIAMFSKQTLKRYTFRFSAPFITGQNITIFKRKSIFENLIVPNADVLSRNNTLANNIYFATSNIGTANASKQYAYVILLNRKRFLDMISPSPIGVQSHVFYDPVPFFKSGISLSFKSQKITPKIGFAVPSFKYNKLFAATIYFNDLDEFTAFLFWSKKCRGEKQVNHIIKLIDAAFQDMQLFGNEHDITIFISKCLNILPKNIRDSLSLKYELENN